MSKKIYRKIEPRIWHDEIFVRLTVEEKLVWLYVLTHPYGNAVGLYRLDTALAASDIQIPAENVESALAAFEGIGLLLRDSDNKLILIRNWMRSNGPTSPNAAAGMLKALDGLPRSALVAEFLQTILDGIETEPEVYRCFDGHRSRLQSALDHICARDGVSPVEGLPKGLRMDTLNHGSTLAHSGTQEQEQEQIRKKKKGVSRAASVGALPPAHRTGDENGRGH